MEHKAAAHIAETAGKTPKRSPEQGGSRRAGERRGTAGGRVELEMTCCWSHAASQKEKALDVPSENVCCWIFGGCGGQTRRSEAFKSQDPRIVLSLTTFHDVSLKSSSSGGVFGVGVVRGQSAVLHSFRRARTTKTPRTLSVQWPRGAAGGRPRARRRRHLMRSEVPSTTRWICNVGPGEETQCFTIIVTVSWFDKPKGISG